MVAKVRASNSVGFGQYSSPSYNGALIVAIPAAPLNAPTRNSPGSTQTSTQVDMQTVTGVQAGGLPILSYQLLWNGGGEDESNWTALVGLATPSTQTSFVHSGLTTGTLHKYKYAVQNEVGWSVASPVMQTYAGTEPSAPSAPTTEIDAL